MGVARGSAGVGAGLVRAWPERGGRGGAGKEAAGNEESKKNAADKVGVEEDRVFRIGTDWQGWQGTAARGK